MEMLHVLPSLRRSGLAKGVVRKMDQKALDAIPTGSSDNLEVYFEEDPDRTHEVNQAIMDRFGVCNQCGEVLWESMKSDKQYVCSYCSDSNDEDGWDDNDDDRTRCDSCGDMIPENDDTSLVVDGGNYCNRRCVTDDLRRSDSYCELVEEVRELLPTPTTSDQVWQKMTDSDVALTAIQNLDSFSEVLQELYPEIEIPPIQEEDDLFA